MNDQERMKEMKRRRVKGVRLLQKGKHPAEVARQTGVSRQSVMRWERALASKGFAQVAQVGQRGADSSFSSMSRDCPNVPVAYPPGLPKARRPSCNTVSAGSSSLPAYAPELNPVECIWGYLKSHAMPNFCAKDLDHLKPHASSPPR